MVAAEILDRVIRTHTPSETFHAGKDLASVLQPGDTVLLIGDLGAGKTVFAQGVASGLGVSQDVTSPTFNLVNVYSGEKAELNHFDLYRLDSPGDLQDIDFYALTDITSGAISVIEWADRFLEEMPEGSYVVTIRKIRSYADDIREICIEEPKARSLGNA